MEMIIEYPLWRLLRLSVKNQIAAKAANSKKGEKISYWPCSKWIRSDVICLCEFIEVHWSSLKIIWAWDSILLLIDDQTFESCSQKGEKKSYDWNQNLNWCEMISKFIEFEFHQSFLWLMTKAKLEAAAYRRKSFLWHSYFNLKTSDQISDVIFFEWSLRLSSNIFLKWWPNFL